VIQTLLIYVALGVVLALALWPLLGMLGVRPRFGHARVRCLVPYVPAHRRPALLDITKGRT
jgi:hypothetical protein